MDSAGSRQRLFTSAIDLARLEAWILALKLGSFEKGSKPKHQTVAFEWHLDGRTYVVEQLRDNAQRRGVRRPTELSSKRDVRCETALQKLNETAAAFAEMHGPHMLDEFGLRSRCSYKQQAETTERDPAAWKVQTRSRNAKWSSKSYFQDWRHF